MPETETLTLSAVLMGAMLCSLLLTMPAQAQSAADDFSTWPRLTNPFESTSGGVMIDGYKPIVSGTVCKTDFSVIIPGAQGGTFLNEVEFDAVPVSGGILCQNGRWRAKDGSNQGTTPFRLFIKDGVIYRPPA